MIDSKITALIAGKLRKYARTLEEIEEYEVDRWVDGTVLTTLELTQAADALEASVRDLSTEWGVYDKRRVTMEEAHSWRDDESGARHRATKHPDFVLVWRKANPWQPALIESGCN